MIGSYGSYGAKTFVDVAGGAILKPGADEDLMVSQDAALATTKPNDPDYFAKREAALRRAYLRRERARLRAGKAAALVASETNGNGGGANFLIPVLLLAAVGLGAFFLFRRKK